jgi:NitT/TauT family transport system substrate-binding protein
MGKKLAVLAGVFLTLGTVALLQGCKRAASNGLVQVKMQTDWYPQPEHGGFYTALAKGYYKDAGLDVQIVPGGPYINAEQQVSTGAAQFAMGSSDRVFAANDNGQALVAVGATMQHDPQAVMVHADSPVKSLTDLSGHAIAIKTGATWFQYVVRHFNLKDVREVPATYSVASFIHDPQYIPYFAKQANVPVRTLLISSTGYDPYRVFFTSQSYAAAHPEVVAKFVQASNRGWQDYMQDPTAANALIQKLNPALDPALMNFSYAALRDGHFIDGDGQLGQFDPDRWKTMEQQLLELKIISKPVDPTTAYTTKFLSK